MAGSLLDAVTKGVLSNVVVEVQLAGLPPFRMSLAPGEGGGGVASTLLKALRPRVVIYADGEPLVTEAPYGEPDAGFPTAFVAVAGVGVSAAVLVALAVRGLVI